MKMSHSPQTHYLHQANLVSPSIFYWRPIKMYFVTFSRYTTCFGDPRKVTREIYQQDIFVFSLRHCIICSREVIFVKQCVFVFFIGRLYLYRFLFLSFSFNQSGICIFINHFLSCRAVFVQLSIFSFMSSSICIVINQLFHVEGYLYSYQYVSFMSSGISLLCMLIFCLQINMVCIVRQFLKCRKVFASMSVSHLAICRVAFV